MPSQLLGQDRVGRTNKRGDALKIIGEKLKSWKSQSAEAGTIRQSMWSVGYFLEPVY